MVPWKLVRGYTHFRGNVSRKSAKEIQSNFYIPFIPINRMTNTENRWCNLIVNRVQDFRHKWVLARKCSLIELLISPIAKSLPQHIITSPEEFFSIADLIDLLSPGKESVILSALTKIDNTAKMHACSECSSFCIVCEVNVSDYSSNVFRCSCCGQRYHRSCLSWSPGETCPLCVSGPRRSLEGQQEDLEIEISIINVVS